MTNTRSNQEEVVNRINYAADELAKGMNCLEQDRLDARKEENLKEQTKSTGGMVKMVSLLTSIDQVGSWDSAYDQHLFKNFSEVKNKIQHSDLDALDNTDIPF